MLIIGSGGRVSKAKCSAGGCDRGGGVGGNIDAMMGPKVGGGGGGRGGDGGGQGGSQRGGGGDAAEW